MRVLLIWENIPEEVKKFVIEDPSEEELSVLKGASGHYGGTGAETEETWMLSDMLCDMDEWCRVPGEDHNCKWSDLEPVDGLIEGPFDLVVSSGWYL